MDITHPEEKKKDEIDSQNNLQDIISKKSKVQNSTINMIFFKQKRREKEEEIKYVCIRLHRH